MTELERMIRQADSAACKIFEIKGEVLPMYHVISADGQETAFAAPHVAVPGVSKDVSVMAVRRLLQDINAVRYVFISEAWMRQFDKDDPELEAATNGKSLENVPGREEVLMYLAEGQDEGELQASREILREPGKKPRLGPLTINQMAESEGRMVGMLPARGARQ